MTNHLPLEIDVAIIGGGPAGAATAIALQKQSKQQVVILEKSHQNSFRIGETIPPNIQPLLSQLDSLDLVTGGDHLPSLGNHSAWGTSELEFQDFFASPQGNGWHLNRSGFDAALLDRAGQKGAIVRRGVSMIGCDPLADGRWNLRLLADNHHPLQLKARFVVDATGRRMAFAGKQGAKAVRMDHLMAMGAVFEFSGEVSQNCYTLVESTELGWWYGALLPQNRAIVTFMSNLELLRKNKFSRWQHWRTYLDKTRYIRELVAEASSQDKLHIEPAFSQYLEPMVGDGWLAVGDAASTFDPLSSSGIYKGLRSGIAGAQAIDGYFRGDPQALANYQSQTLRQFELYLEDRRHYYRLEKRWPGSSFWQKYCGKVSLSPSKLLHFSPSSQGWQLLDRLKMYFPVPELQLLCQLCADGQPASYVVAEFLTRTQRKVSAYRIIEALQYLLREQVIHQFGKS